MQKLRVPNINVVRIDLVFDSTKMSNLLESRGSAVKNQNLDELEKIEHQIAEQKEYQYHADVVGAFVTYETEKELRDVLSLF